MTTRVVTTFWVDTFSADLVALAVGLSALAEHLEEGRWLFAGDDIHVPLNWVTSIVQSVPIPPYNKFRTVRIPRYYGTLCNPSFGLHMRHEEGYAGWVTSSPGMDQAL